MASRWKGAEREILDLALSLGVQPEKKLGTPANLCVQANAWALNPNFIQFAS